MADRCHPELDHFLNLVAQGDCPGACDGARRAKKIAECLVENLPGLDGQAVDGLRTFVDLVDRMPTTARDLISKSTNA